MPQILKNRCNFTLRWRLDLGNTSLEQNIRLKTLGYLLFIPAIFFVCCLAAPWPTFGCYWANSLTHSLNHPVLVNHCICAISFWPRAGLGGVGSLHLTECPVNFDHNAITLQIAENTLRRLKPSFSKCGNAHNTQNRYSLTFWWSLGLQNTSLDTKFKVRNF